MTSGIFLLWESVAKKGIGKVVLAFLLVLTMTQINRGLVLSLIQRQNHTQTNDNIRNCELHQTSQTCNQATFYHRYGVINHHMNIPL